MPASDKSNPTRPRIYLAGPEVFLPNANDIGAAKAALCAEAGFEGVFPLDTGLDLDRPVFGYTNIPGDYKARAVRFRQTAADWRDSDRPDIDVEDFGLIENLMIDIALRETAHEPVVTAVPAGAELTDLDGFRRCLALAANLLKIT
jgi:nucleoside 2-deoxyribosyltransferase